MTAKQSAYLLDRLAAIRNDKPAYHQPVRMEVPTAVKAAHQIVKEQNSIIENLKCAKRRLETNATPRFKKR